jgi:hypothetical protein
LAKERRLHETKKTEEPKKWEPSEEQLGQLEHLSEKIEILTTNKSQLQIGFYAFFSFTLLGLFISTKLHSQISEIDDSTR